MSSSSLQSFAIRRAALLLFACAAIAFTFSTARGELPPIVPRDVLFSEPERGGAQISPDGQWITYLARNGAGHLELWRRRVDEAESTRVDRGSKGFPLVYFWTGDSRHVLYQEDHGSGNESWHLHSLDLESGTSRDLTPFENARVENVFVSLHHPNQVLVGLNRRDPSVFDVHRIDLETGEVVLDTQNPGDVIAWTADRDFVIRAATALNPKDGSSILRVRDKAGAPWRDLATWSFDEAGMDRYQKILGFTPDGRALYVQSPIGSNTTRLVTIDLASGKETTLLEADEDGDLWNKYDPSTAVMEVERLVDPRTGRIQAVAVNPLIPEWIAIGAGATTPQGGVREDLATLAKVQPGVFTVTSKDLADRRWIVRYEISDGPASYYLYERDGKRARFLFHDRPALASHQLAKMQPEYFSARDGLRIPAYLTTPPGIPAKKLPLVLLVHGGPWFRDEWGFQPEVQWLANRGYAVLQVQFRGSAGFGTKFLNAGTGGMGTGGMQHDLTDAVGVMVTEGIADPKRIAIMGGSYGGYATLAGLAFTPEIYTCGVDMVGPSNLKTMIESFPPYWALRRKRWLLRIGDVIADADLNRRISPVFHAEKIKAPLLIGHGANDPRAKLEESEQMVKALRDRGVAVEFVVYPDEGHGFGRPENMQDWSTRVEQFLARHLGGRVEPARRIAGTSAEQR